jgi:hypothetical protein
VPDMSGAVTLFPIPQSFVVPQIGQSFDLLGGRAGAAAAFDAGDQLVRTTPSTAGGSKFFYIKDANSFSEAMTFSMKTGGGGWGASYGMTADASALLQTSSLTQSIHFRGVGQASQAVIMPDVALSPAAAKILAQGMAAFTQRFGTHFVAGYVYGKSCYLSYELNFSTLSLATQFSGSFSESESIAGFSEDMQTKITNTLNESKSSCHFSVAFSYRGFDSVVSPANMADLAKVMTDYGAASGDSTPVLLVIYPWTYLDQVNAASSAGLPINDPLQDLALLTNKLIYLKQSSQNFIDADRFAGGTQWNAIRAAVQPVQKELDHIQTYLQSCNANSTAVTEAAVDKFAPAEPLADQMNTALARSYIAFSVSVGGWNWTTLAAADELTPQSQALHLSADGHQLATVYNDQSKGVWFDLSAVHNLCSVPNANIVVGITPDATSGTLVAWCISTAGNPNGHVSPSLKLFGSTNSRSVDDPDNTAKLYWHVNENGVDITLNLCPV